MEDIIVPIGLRIDPYQAFNFLVEIEGLLVGGFTECSGLQAETEYFDYREGGVNEYLHRFTGPTKFPLLVLKRGLTRIDELWAWHQEVAMGLSEGKAISRRNGSIYLLDRKQDKVMWWNIKEAFPVKWTGPEFRADSGNVAIESLELAHRGLSRPAARSLEAILGIRL